MFSFSLFRREPILVGSNSSLIAAACVFLGLVASPVSGQHPSEHALHVVENTAPHSPNEKYNLIPEQLQYGKYVFFSINAFLCIVFAGWTIYNRNEWIVKVAQPKLLIVMIIGCFISSLSILFEGIETEYRTLVIDGELTDIENPDVHRVDAACAAFFWLQSMGFCVSISMICARIGLVKMIHQASVAKKKNKKKKDDDDTSSTPPKKYGFKDVAPVVAIIFGIQLAIMIPWQIVDPPQWFRHAVETEDGMITESHGGCTTGIYLDLVIATQVLILFYALVLCWQTRDIDDDFAESFHLSLIVLFYFQIYLVLMPVHFVVHRQSDPNISIAFLLVTFYLFLSDFILLAGLFIPKILKLYTMKKNDKHDEDDDDENNNQKKKATIPLSALTHSRWDEAVDNINGILNQDENAFHALSEEQRNGLASAKSLLLKRVKGEEEDKLRFLPEGLIQKDMFEEDVGQSGRRSSLGMRYRPKRGIKVDKTTRFLMREYGGIDIFQIDKTYDEEDVGTALSNKDNDIESGIGSIQSSVRTTEDDDDIYYIPKEFRGLSEEAKVKAFQLLSWKNLGRWDYNIFDLAEVSGGHPLLFMGYAILGSPHSLYAMGKDCGEFGSNKNNDVSIENLEGYHFIDNDHLKIPMRKLCNYLRVMEEDYNSENPYHNEIHGADVLQTLHALLQMKGDIFPTTNEELFSILLSAIVHDVNHPGENNAFQINSQTDLTLVYNDISVLENRHASHAFTKMLTQRRGKDASQGRDNDNKAIIIPDNFILCNAKKGTVSDIRKRVIDAVLHTDMSKHFQTVDATRALIMSGGVEKDDDGPWKILQYMLHLADISNPAKPKQMALLWTDRCLEEFFAQGDKESKLGLTISPNCDRNTTKKPDSQIGFINFVIKPAYEVLAQIIPGVKDQILTPHIETNLQYWKDEKAKNDGGGEQART